MSSDIRRRCPPERSVKAPSSEEYRNPAQLRHCTRTWYTQQEHFGRGKRMGMHDFTGDSFGGPFERSKQRDPGWGAQICDLIAR